MQAITLCISLTPLKRSIPMLWGVRVIAKSALLALHCIRQSLEARLESLSACHKPVMRINILSKNLHYSFLVLKISYRYVRIKLWNNQPVTIATRLVFDQLLGAMHDVELCNTNSKPMQRYVTGCQGHRISYTRKLSGYLVLVCKSTRQSLCRSYSPTYFEPRK